MGFSVLRPISWSSISFWANLNLSKLTTVWFFSKTFKYGSLSSTRTFRQTVLLINLHFWGGGQLDWLDLPVGNHGIEVLRVDFIGFSVVNVFENPNKFVGS
jgi:hypothetical protein